MQGSSLKVKFIILPHCKSGKFVKQTIADFQISKSSEAVPILYDAIRECCGGDATLSAAAAANESVAARRPFPIQTGARAVMT